LGILKNIYRAISDGVDVRGYLHWALLDNFEWEKGFWPRFGLIEVDYETLERKIRPSAYFYRDIIRENGITKEIVNKYAKQIEVYPKETIRLSKVS
jgi:beta-glucosidase